MQTGAGTRKSFYLLTSFLRPRWSVIARLFLPIPFPLIIAANESYSTYPYVEEGYEVRLLPPIRSDSFHDLESITMDGVQAIQADILRIDFHKESFDRSPAVICDPPPALIKRAINSFLTRLRHVASAYQVREIDFPRTNWELKYLNDDGTEVAADPEPEPTKRLARGRFGKRSSIRWTAVPQRVWSDIHSLPTDYQSLPWVELLLEARFELPRIGPAVVLAATALEVFIARILDQLAVHQSVPENFWKWITDRGDYRKDPSVEEQYDVLLEFFVGRSLKADAGLWEAFKNLKAARNSFVHTGAALVGGKTIMVEMANQLIHSATEIILLVRTWVPDSIQWPVFNYEIHVDASKVLLEAADTDRTVIGLEVVGVPER
jgi:hypothetical protein